MVRLGLLRAQFYCSLPQCLVRRLTYRVDIWQSLRPAENELDESKMETDRQMLLPRQEPRGGYGRGLMRTQKLYSFRPQKRGEM